MFLLKHIENRNIQTYTLTKPLNTLFNKLKFKRQEERNEGQGLMMFPQHPGGIIQFSNNQGDSGTKAVVQ